MSGYGSGTFAGDRPITREQFAVILCNYAKSRGQDVSVKGTAASGFRDFREVSNYAVPGMQWAVENGVINGDGEKLNPKGRVTRAAAAQMLKNFLKK